MKEMAKTYARLINQCKFKYQTLFSANLYELDEDDQVNDEIELHFNLQFN